MYEVLLKDESAEEVKVTYIGLKNYSDAWVQKDEVLTRIEKGTYLSSVEERVAEFLSKCAILIKKSLCISNRYNNVIKFNVDVDEDVYNAVFGRLGNVVCRGLNYTVVPENSELDPYLGPGWNIRVLNRSGDFIYVVPGTFKTGLKCHRPLKEYVPSGCGLMEKWIWQGMFCEIEFIPGFGVGNDYCQCMWYSSDSIV